MAIYKTYSFGGMEGRTLVEDYFNSEKAAKAAALRNTWNDGYFLYKVTITERDKGRISMDEELVTKLISGRDIKCKDMSWMKEDERKAIEEFLLSDEYKELVEFNQTEETPIS